MRNQMKNQNMKSMPPQLYKAVATNNIDLLRQLSTDRDLEISLFVQRIPRGDTLLHIAASLGYDQHVQEILSTSANTSSSNVLLIRETNNDRETALHLALKNRHKGIARMLFEKDPKVTHYVNREGKSPLYMAVEAGYMEIFKAMMEDQDGNNPDDLMKQKVVHVCIDGKNGGILDILLLKKWISAVTSVDERGKNSLSYAALVGYTEGVRRILIEFGEYSYVADENGFFPIHMASSKGHIDIIRVSAALSRFKRAEQ
ncbi:protein ACCELERATED CELL DEATH 6-like [Ziziphus jujuba]|uniref:Protein ACCELERATED CELL DEATH 6-like n=1 Tax=Ziziphus jujuba TaxID=326968 RepID=A0ABM4A7Q1_ZIZJJ|nr:protein ACCELERATED CELL DEATH 6-like [Ziziphus jujuba]